jgi:hypothetical protein
MTQREFSSQLFQVIKNSIEENKSEIEIIDDVELFIDILEPKDIEQFCKWGFPTVQVEPSKCWNIKQRIYKTGDSVRGSWIDKVTGKTYYTEGIIIEKPKTGLWVQEQPDGGITHLSDFFFIEIKQTK